VSESRNLDLQETARLITDQMAFDTRNAGMMIPKEAAVSSADGAAQPDRFCASDSSYFRVRTTNLWDNRTERFPGPDATWLNAGSISINTFDIDSDAGIGASLPNDWLPAGVAVGAGGLLTPNVGVIVARRDGSASFCARLTNFVTPVVGGPSTLTLAAGDLPNFSAGALSLVAVPAIVYEWQKDPDPLSTNPGLLLRNGVPISAQIEDLQVEFWVDTAVGNYPNGVIEGQEFPRHGLLAFPAPPAAPPSVELPKVNHTSRIRNVRISVVARGDLPDEVAGNQVVARGRRPAVANRPAGPPDAFTRRIYTVSLLPRNLLDDLTLTLINVP
jgi:hypothetical protein